MCQLVNIKHIFAGKPLRFLRHILRVKQLIIFNFAAPVKLESSINFGAHKFPSLRCKKIHFRKFSYHCTQNTTWLENIVEPTNNLLCLIKSKLTKIKQGFKLCRMKIPKAIKLLFSWDYNKVCNWPIFVAALIIIFVAYFHHHCMFLLRCRKWEEQNFPPQIHHWYTINSIIHIVTHSSYSMSVQIATCFTKVAICKSLTFKSFPGKCRFYTIFAKL